LSIFLTNLDQFSALAAIGGLFTGVRGIEILRTSPFGHSQKFAFTDFYEVHQESIKYHSFEGFVG